MILEEKIVRIVILASIFFGLFNLLGQFNGFLTPFIFNYTTVTIVALIFCFRNWREKDLGPLIAFTFSYAIITLFSGQFIYLINLFSHDKVLIDLNEWYLLLNYLIFWSSIFLVLIKLYKNNSERKIKYFLSSQIALLIVFIFLFIGNHLLSSYLFIGFSILFSSNLILPKIQFSNGIHRFILLIFLNLSLEILKIASIAFI